MDKHIYKYYRISSDDDGAAESNSISSQRQIVENFISSDEDLSNMSSIEIVDDGYSGTNFDRPGMSRLLEAVRRGEVSCIIVKDLSRFGRKFLEVSKYIEQLFPYLGIRFIAIGDSYDSDNHKGTTPDIDVPVRNMLNALYSKDISKKVKSAKQSQARQGKYIHAFAPYGYKKNPADKHSIIIDEPAAQIVRQIFDLTCNGQGPRPIANILNAEGVLTPSAYKKQNGSNLNTSGVTGALWSEQSVSRILRNEVYTGVFISGKVEMGELGTNKLIRKPKEEWIRIPNAHPAIISQKAWNDVATKREQTNWGYGKPDTSRILYKRVRCGYCNHVMRFRTDGQNGKYRRYICKTPKYSEEYGCLSNGYSEQEIVDVVKSVVQAQLKVMLDMEKLLRTAKDAAKHDALSKQTSIEQLDREIEYIQASKRQLYERYKSDSFSKDEYLGEREKTDINIGEKIDIRDSLAAHNTKQVGDADSAHRFFSSFSTYQSDTEPSAEIVNALVESVHIFGIDRMEITFTFKDEFDQVHRALNAR